MHILGKQLPCQEPRFAHIYEKEMARHVYENWQDN